MSHDLRHIARWDLNKTYLRTEFASLRDLVRTALELPFEKRAHPGAASLIREFSRGGSEIHILSGSPEQMRRGLEAKLRLDGVTWNSLTLKPNLSNALRFRFRAIKDQLGYKLPALVHARLLLRNADDAVETLFGDDAEADAFVYSLYADLLDGRVSRELLSAICTRGRMYEDVYEKLVQDVVSLGTVGNVVERILIHLEGQTVPDEFEIYGTRVVPFYNYLQAAFVVHDDGRLPASGVLHVAAELLTEHRFDGEALARSYLDLAKRGCISGRSVATLEAALEEFPASHAARPGLEYMLKKLPEFAARVVPRKFSHAMPDYLSIVTSHNKRRHK